MTFNSQGGGEEDDLKSSGFFQGFWMYERYLLIVPIDTLIYYAQQERNQIL
jgi:hypothetical protein